MVQRHGQQVRHWEKEKKLPKDEENYMIMVTQVGVTRKDRVRNTYLQERTKVIGTSYRRSKQNIGAY